MTSPASPETTLQVGQLLIYPGQGVVQVSRFFDLKGEPGVEVVTGLGGRIGGPLKAMRAQLHAPMPAARAEQVLARLARQDGAPDTRHTALRINQGWKTKVLGSFDQQVEVLHGFYRSPYRLGFGEMKLVMTLEDNVLGEIALAKTGGTELHAVLAARDDLSSELHAKFTAFAPKAPQRPPEPPLPPPEPADPFELTGATYLGSFTVKGGQLVTGDPVYVGGDDPGKGESLKYLLLGAVNGTWHAYVRYSEDRPSVLFAFADPAALGGTPPTAPTQAPAGRVWVDSGNMAIVDAAVRSAPETREAMTFPLFSEDLVRDRGCQSASGGGDGVYPVFASMKDGKAVWLAVEFEHAPEGGLNPTWQFVQEMERKLRLGRPAK